MSGFTKAVAAKPWASMENSKKSIKDSSGIRHTHPSFFLFHFTFWCKLQSCRRGKSHNYPDDSQVPLSMATMLKTTVTLQVDHVFDGISSLKVVGATSKSNIWWNLNKAYHSIWKIPKMSPSKFLIKKCVVKRDIFEWLLIF